MSQLIPEIRHTSAGRTHESRRSRPTAAPTLLVVLLATATACASPDHTAQGDDRSDLRIVVVTRGQSADPFWSVVANGVRAAAPDMGGRAEYRRPRRSTWSR